MKILALIPARGGSKRVPNKNIKHLGGLPLIAWSIRAALESKCCVDVVVSTDNAIIAEISRIFGASVPWLRPPELSSDTAGSVDVAIHALNAYETEHDNVDGLLLLQPTSPFRTPNDIRQAIELFRTKGRRAIISVSPATSHPAWCFRALSEGIEPFLGWDAMEKRSQDLEDAWMLNGSIYLISPTQLQTERKFINEDVIPYFMVNQKDQIDIDNEMDFQIAEIYMKNKYNRNC